MVFRTSFTLANCRCSFSYLFITYIAVDMGLRLSVVVGEGGDSGVVNMVNLHPG